MTFFVRSYSYPTQSQLDAAVDDVADLLATDRYSLAEIAAFMGVTIGTVCVILRRLCERYGEAVA